MSDTPNVTFVLAFIGGILSFLSPCVLPLVPSYLGFVTGFTINELSDRRRMAMIHALLFVAGFTLIFMLFGATATAQAPEPARADAPTFDRLLDDLLARGVHSAVS